MWKKIGGIFVVTLLIGTILTTITSVSACTGFTASDGNIVLVGNNEDISISCEPKVMVYPPNEDTNSYGRIMFYCKWPYPFIGSGYNAFGGMNDQGLFFDCYSHPYLTPVNSSDKPKKGGLIAYCMRTCATVEEVLEEFNKYNLTYMHSHQIFIADSTGDSAIIEGDEIIRKEGTFQVVTNFLQSNPDHGWYPCWRYDTAIDMLNNMPELSLPYFKEICNATHQEDIHNPTIYSNVCDLTNGKMYLYLMHDFEHVIELNLTEEFAKGQQSHYLLSLFEPDNNQAPDTPQTPSGPKNGRSEEEYTYTCTGKDPDNDRIFYLFDWGDETPSYLLGPYDSNESCTISHTWTIQGDYEIKVKTQDVYGQESDWSDPLAVSMPKNKSMDNPLLHQFLKRLLERLPLLASLLHQRI